MKKKRPFLLKLIIFSLALIAIMGWLRVYQSIYQWEFLVEYAIKPGPWYSLITGALVGILASIAVVSAWFQWYWSGKFMQISLLVITIGWWLDYLFFSRSSIVFYNLPFRIVATVIYLGFVFGYYYLKKIGGEK